MDLANIFKQYIPNPLSTQSNLPDLEKKSEIITESWNLVRISKSIIILILIGFVLANLFKLPTHIVSLLISIEIFSLLLIAFIKYLKIRSLSSIEANDNNYKQLLVTSWRYDVLGIVFRFGASIVTGSMLFFLCRQALSASFIQGTTSFNSTLSLKNLLIIFIIFRFFELVVNILAYQLIKNINENQNLAQMKQKVSLIYVKLKLIKNIPGFLVLLVVLTLSKIPFYIISIFWIVFGLLFFSSLGELWRIGKSNLSIRTRTAVDDDIKPSTLPTDERIEKQIRDKMDSKLTEIKASRNIENITIRGDEKIAQVIFGIMNLNRTGFALLRVGQTTKPENTLLITNYRMLFIQVPATGGNKIIDGNAYGDMNFFWNRSEIEERGKQIIRSESLGNIVKSYGMREFAFDDIRNVALKKMEITILTNNNEEHKYLFMDRDNVDLLKEKLRIYLKEKFIEVE